MASLRPLATLTLAFAAGGTLGRWVPGPDHIRVEQPVVASARVSIPSDVAGHPGSVALPKAIKVAEEVDSLDGEIVAALARQDLPRAFAALKRLALLDGYRAMQHWDALMLRSKSDLAMKEDFFKEFAELIATPVVDAEGMLKAVLEKNERTGGDVVTAIFGAVARRDPERAWHSLLGSAERTNRWAATAIGQSWAASAPAAALAFIAQQPASLNKSAFIKGVTGEWAKHSVSDMLAWHRQQPDAMLWDDDIDWGALRPGNADELTTMLRELPGRSPKRNDSAYNHLAHIFDQAPNLQMAESWVRALPTGPQRQAAADALVMKLLDTDPEAALAWRDELGSIKMKRLVSSTVAAFRAAQSPAAGVAYALTIGGGEATDLALESVVQTWALRDARSAVVTAQAHPEWHVDMRNLLSVWAEVEPNAASAFALDHNNGKLLEAPLKAWVKVQPEAASRWVLELPAGPMQERGTFALANSLTSLDPAAAVEWALRVQNSAHRTSLLSSGFRQWVARDSGAAAAWLTAHTNLDEAVRGKLQSLLSNPK